MGLNLSSIFGTTKPSQLNPTQFQEMVNKYGFIDKATYDKYKVLPEFANAQVKPVGSGMAAIDKTIIDSLSNNYMALDKSKLGNDVVSKALLGRGTGIDNSFYVKKSDFDYYNSFADSANKSKIGYYGLNSIADPFQNASVVSGFTNYPGMDMSIDGKTMRYIPYEAGARITRDKDKDKITYLTDALGNEDLFKYGKAVNFSGSTLDAIKNSIANTSKNGFSGTDFNFENPGLGYLFTPEDYDKYVFNKMTRNAADADFGQANGGINTGRAYHDDTGLENAWLYRNYDPKTGQNLNMLSALDGLPSGVGSSDIMNQLQSAKWFAQSTTDPQMFSYMDNTGHWKRVAYDQWVEKKKKGGFLGSVSEVLSPVMSVLSVVPNPIQPIAAAYTAANSLTSGVMNGNPLQIASGLLGGYGVLNPGTNIASSVGGKINDGLGLGLSKSAIQALGQGTLGTGLGLLGGQNLGKALQGGLATGLSGYAGGQLGQLFKQNGVDPILAKALTGAGASGLNALLRGNTSNLGTSALAGLFSGGISGVGQANGMKPATANNLGQLLTMLALKQRAARRG